MLLTQLSRPIDVFNISEWGVDVERLKRKLAASYEDYAWDDYLFRQTQIEFFKTHLSEAQLAPYSNQFWMEYYTGRVSQNEVDKMRSYLSPSEQSDFDKIRPTRKRLISEFNMYFENGQWQLERSKPARVFGQEYALTIDEDDIDYRLAKRTFKEMPSYLDDESLQSILYGLAEELREKDSMVTNINVFVHHTLVYCYPDQLGTNSPEGIHQDGMDYIVSALVMERHNVNGGKSVIYGSDMRTKVMETVLQSGQGILQPDKDTELWHEVTSICPQDGELPGYRSTIGFDITVVSSASASSDY